MQATKQNSKTRYEPKAYIVYANGVDMGTFSGMDALAAINAYAKHTNGTTWRQMCADHGWDTAYTVRASWQNPFSDHTKTEVVLHEVEAA